MRARNLIVTGAVLLLPACQTQKVYQVERSRTYEQPKQAVWDRLLAVLEQSQIEVDSSDFAAGKLTAARHDFEDQGWADCERRRVSDNSSSSTRMGWALRVDRDLALQADVAEAAGATQVAVDARFTEEQINTWSYQHFMQPCRSTGVLEKALLDALAPPK